MIRVMCLSAGNNDENRQRRLKITRGRANSFSSLAAPCLRLTPKSEERFYTLRRTDDKKTKKKDTKKRKYHHAFRGSTEKLKR